MLEGSLPLGPLAFASDPLWTTLCPVLLPCPPLPLQVVCLGFLEPIPNHYDAANRAPFAKFLAQLGIAPCSIGTSRGPIRLTLTPNSLGNERSYAKVLHIKVDP